LYFDENDYSAGQSSFVLFSDADADAYSMDVPHNVLVFASGKFHNVAQLIRQWGKGTPQDFRDRLLSVNGAAFSLEPQLFQSAWFRPHNRSEEVEGLYMVGAGTHPGAGVPGVISSAKILDQLVPEGVAYRR
jgi:phytoene dehydrogenase-like protein